jgi:hypothetical protein
VRLQIVDVRGRAFLVTGSLRSGTPPTWQVDAVYD